MLLPLSRIPNKQKKNNAKIKCQQIDTLRQMKPGNQYSQIYGCKVSQYTFLHP